MTTQPKQTRKWRIALLIVGAVAVLGLLISSSRQAQNRPPLPSPNGYDDFIKAGQMVDRNLDYREMDTEQLRKAVAQNAAALRLARTGLNRECRTPVGYFQAEQSEHLSKLALIKVLAQALSAEGKLASLENRNNDAAQSYLDAMRLGHEATRGGPLIDGLVRIACEAIGTQGLQSSATNFQAKECREVIAALDVIEQKQEAFSEVLQNEKEWVRQNFSPYQRVVGHFMRLFNVGSIKQAEKKSAQRFQAQDQRRHALLISIATRAYELEKGQPLKSVSDLVPDFLKTLPKDLSAATNGAAKP